MSQDQTNNSNDEDRPLVIRHYPPRAANNRAYIPYDKANRANRSPSNVLRMISRLPQFSSPEPLTTTASQSSATSTFKEPLPSIRKAPGTSYAEFKEQYMKIGRVDPLARPLRPKVQLEFVHKKVRHLDTMSDTLSEFTFHTTTNYSRLDEGQVHPAPQLQPPLESTRYPEDDTRSIATQDMLLDEDDGQVVLDSQQILELQQKMELIQPAFEEQPPLFEPPTQQRKSPVSQHSIHRKSSTPPIIEQKPRNKGKEKEEIVRTTEENTRDKGKEKEEMTRYTTPITRKESVPSIGNTPEPNYMEDAMNEIGSDWGFDDDYGDDYGNDMERESDTRNPHSTKRVLPGASTIINDVPESVEASRPFGQKLVRDRFSTKLDFNRKLFTPMAYFDKVWDAYASQMGHDLKAYIEHRKNGDENDNTLLKEDVILLMKRQRLINDQNSLESVAFKHLPRESWDALCTSALTDNILYPPLRTSFVTSTFDRNDDDEEDDDDDETMPDSQPQRSIDFD